MSDDVTAVEDILDRLQELGDDSDRASIGDVLGAIGSRGFGPLLFTPALIEISPIGGIPGVPTFLAAIIALVAIQMIVGRDHVWLPGVIERRSVEGGKLRTAADKLRPIGAWMDRHFSHRLTRLTGPGMQRLAAGACLLLCLTVPPLEIVPFASTAPTAAIAAIGLAITARDGLLMLVGFAATAGAVGFGLWMLLR
ncbi:exopolysaccharide synthesis exoD [Oceaniovalibus guishaninsula JLT2003]|uniref:Exopolysaccharide synthesis exoD n=1 Tax=Oceaniovalibus guishaninsula JLT2003 TaxID=1231392 RepID=K2I5P6_9RHOB|nr:exopolysaccharide biosynthesis protein [Oceaniovalibus guishaninsula]EKE44270.1 exopolysaccharide synthesis exoD [Oceaniovalibus guishaninsula JLT2003]